jgi:SHS family lactate transporter-like MFS transporter
MLIYLIFMMAGFNFLSHGSQDIYPTFLESTLNFTHGLVTVTTILANCGAIVGGTLVGYFSSFFGRRLSILVVLILGALLIPAYVLPHNKNIMIGAFFQQMCVQGVWGVVPIHLMELSPVNFRSFVVGTAYQLGNLISAASSTIEAKAAQHSSNKTVTIQSTVKEEYDYGTVIAVLLTCVYVYLFIIIFLGPEKRNMDEATSNNNNNNNADNHNETYNDMQLEKSSSSSSSSDRSKIAQDV